LFLPHKSSDFVVGPVKWLEQIQVKSDYIDRDKRQVVEQNCLRLGVISRVQNEQLNRHDVISEFKQRRGHEDHEAANEKHQLPNSGSDAHGVP
jgi:hypothetical protein